MRLSTLLPEPGFSPAVSLQNPTGCVLPGDRFVKPVGLSLQHRTFSRTYSAHGIYLYKVFVATKLSVTFLRSFKHFLNQQIV